MSELKWWQKPIRMARHEWMAELHRIKDLDLDEIAREHAEDWNINCEWIIGTPGIAPGTAWLTTFNSDKFEKWPELGDFDLLREYIPYCRARGIHPLAYLNMHWYSYDFGEKHPDWLQLMSDGREYGRVNPLYASGTTLCVNTPWRDWAAELIREAMKTGLDGLFLDGPVVFPDCCYCDTCVAKFKAIYGAEPPRGEDWSNPLYKEFIDFREQSMADFLHHVGDAMREVNPDGVIFLNAGSWHGGAWRVARDVAAVGPYQEFNGAEAFYHLGHETEPYFWSMAAKHLRGGNKPAIVFVHHCLGTWHYLPLPDLETQIAGAQTVACGAGTWLAAFQYALENATEETIEPMRRINGFLKANEEYCTDPKSPAKIAYLYSGQSAKFYISYIDELFTDIGDSSERDLTFERGTGEVVRDWKARKVTCDAWQGDTYRGWFNALTRAHVTFDVILEAGLLDGSLDKYETLVIGNAACLTDEQKQAIVDFVARGGNLVAEFEAGAYDERGGQADNDLNALLGIDSLNGAFKPAAGEEYIDLGDAAHGVVADFHTGRWLARPVNVLKIKATDDTEAVGYYMNPIGLVYTKPKGLSEWPAMLCKEGKNGAGRVVYLAGLFSQFYAVYKMEDYAKLLATAVKWAHGSPLQMRVSAPPTVETELWTQPDENRLVLHIVNNTADMQRPMTAIVPVHDIQVELDYDAVAAKSARGTDVALEKTATGVKLTVSQVDIYDIIVIDLA